MEEVEEMMLLVEGEVGWGVVEAEDLLEIQETVDSEAVVAQILGVLQGLDLQVSEAVKQELHLLLGQVLELQAQGQVGQEGASLQDKAHLVEPQEEQQLEASFQEVD